MGAADDDLYDAYLDACSEGRVEEPDVFLARHPQAPPELRAQLEAVRALAGRRVASAAEATADADLPFERLGEFRLLSRLDQGGMGSVFLARQDALRRDVAVKVLRPELRSSPTAEERFRREAVALARLRHPNIVAVHAVGEERGVRFIAMDFVEGRSLDELVGEAAAAGRTLAPARVLRWGTALARALQCAHEAGVVHRDVKPANVRITKDERPMLLDFGVARDEAAGPSLTQTFAGSPLYAAPEQLAGAGADLRADVWSLGATLYQALAGRVPFAGESMAEVTARAIAEPPVPPRRLNPSLSRDAELVILKALEKEPERRYASAAAFADDLERALDGRPVVARPASLLRTSAHWARRHAVASAVLVTTLAGAGAAAGLAASARASERAANRERAGAALVAARGRLDALRAGRESARELTESVAALRVERRSRHLTDTEDASLQADEDALLALSRERETAVYDVLELLRSADQLDPARSSETDALRADVFAEKWREARAARDAGAAAFYRARAERFDADGRLAAELHPVLSRTIVSEPAGAEVRLFRFRDLAEVSPGGAHRLVAVPLSSPVLAAGSLALRVERSSGGVVAGDHILRLGGRDVAEPSDEDAASRGGVVAMVLHEGREAELTLPAGLDVRLTALPLVASRADGVTPLSGVALEEGEYLALLRLPGHREGRLVFRVANDGTAAELRAVLRRDDELPPGFVPVTLVGSGRPFAIQEREVTCGEYLEFLNDAGTQARLASAGDAVLFPRTYDNVREGGFWPRGEGGRFVLPAGWDARWPVLGVSFDDARSYAEWLTARARAGGRGETYRLPRLEEWAEAAGAHATREYPFGDTFNPRWVKSCFSRATASPEPVRSYPVDESPFGVFDMAGSAAEWVDAWFDEARGSRRLCGSSWAQADGSQFRIFAASGLAPNASTSETGFRLVADLPAR